MKYYRTYVTTFERSNGIFVYAGKHESYSLTPTSDPYYGSGMEIKRAVTKYGRDCIKSILWFEHTNENQMNISEKILIMMRKSIFGSRCVNRAGGGHGGNTMRFSDLHSRELRSSRIKDSHNTEEYKKLMSSLSTSMWESPSHRQNISEKMIQVHSDVDYKSTHSKSTRRGIRNNRDHFNEPLKRIIYDTWIQNNKPGDHKLSKLLRCGGYNLTRSQLYALMDEFKEYGYVAPENTNA